MRKILYDKSNTFIANIRKLCKVRKLHLINNICYLWKGKEIFSKLSMKNILKNHSYNEYIYNFRLLFFYIFLSFSINSHFIFPKISLLKR